MPRVLPPNPSLEHLKKQAKALLRAFRAQDVDAHARFREALPRLASADDRVVRQVKVSLQEAQLVLAHEYGFGDWQQLALHVDPKAARPRSHRRMITPPEWSTNTVYVNQDSGRAMIGTSFTRTLAAAARGAQPRRCSRAQTVPITSVTPRASTWPMPATSSVTKGFQA